MVRIHTVVHEYNKTAGRDNNNFWFISFFLSYDLKRIYQCNMALHSKYEPCSNIVHALAGRF